MKRNDLKKLIKPLVKECIHEVLIEEGMLSNIVSEVAQGMQGNLMVEDSPRPQKALYRDEPPRRSPPKLQERRQKLLDSIGKDAYNGVNLFEGIDPMETHSEPKAGAVDLGNARDPGVDISSLMGGASQIWKAMK